jgi:hypothetical protein
LKYEGGKATSLTWGEVSLRPSQSTRLEADMMRPDGQMVVACRCQCAQFRGRGKCCEGLREETEMGRNRLRLALAHENETGDATVTYNCHQ